MDRWPVTKGFSLNTAPRYLIRDRDAVYGHAFVKRVREMGIRDRPISARSPWQNGHVERLIGSIRRECIDHTGCSVRHTCAACSAHTPPTTMKCGPHLSLDKNAPIFERFSALGKSPRSHFLAAYIISTSGSNFR